MNFNAKTTEHGIYIEIVVTASLGKVTNKRQD